MEQALDRHKAKEARVVPIILRDVDWHVPPLDKLQALPTDAKPVTSWTNPDEAFADVVRGIKRTIEALKEERERKLNVLYRRGQQYMQTGKWLQALQCFEEIQRLAPGYNDNESLLVQVRQKLAKRNREIRQGYTSSIQPNFRVRQRASAQPDTLSTPLPQKSQLLSRLNTKLPITKRKMPRNIHWLVYVGAGMITAL